MTWKHSLGFYCISSEWDGLVTHSSLRYLRLCLCVVTWATLPSALQTAHLLNQWRSLWANPQKELDTNNSKGLKNIFIQEVFTQSMKMSLSVFFAVSVLNHLLNCWNSSHDKELVLQYQSELLLASFTSFHQILPRIFTRDKKRNPKCFHLQSKCTSNDLKFCLSQKSEHKFQQKIK